jgi:hypothetical protein
MYIYIYIHTHIHTHTPRTHAHAHTRLLFAREEETRVEESGRRGLRK